MQSFHSVWYSYLTVKAGTYLWNTVNILVILIYSKCNTNNTVYEVQQLSGYSWNTVFLHELLIFWYFNKKITWSYQKQAVTSSKHPNWVFCMCMMAPGCIMVLVSCFLVGAVKKCTVRHQHNEECSDLITMEKRIQVDHPSIHLSHAESNPVV
jgi:hypothetical protein